MELLALEQGTTFHIYINFFLIILLCGSFFTHLIFSNFSKINKIIWYITPLLFGTLAITLISGFSVLAMNKFALDSRIYAMIMLNIFIIICEIIRAKKLKIARENPTMQKSYKILAVSLQGIAIVMIIALNLM